MAGSDNQKNTTSPVYVPVIAFCIVVKFIIFFLSANRYGFMSDELYFLDASTHPALGYADFPPMISWLAAAIRWTLGESLWSIRLVAMLIGLCTTLVAVDLCRAIGGGRVAQWLAAIAVLFAPGVLSIQGLLTMNVLDQLWWLLGFRLLFAYLAFERPSTMSWLGLVLGLGILTKFSILALCLGISASVLVWNRELLQRRETLEAILIAIICVFPFTAWQVRNDFPMFNFLQDYNAGEPLAIVLQQPLIGLVLTMNPLFALLWVPGAIHVYFGMPTSLRILGSAAWLSLAFLILAGVKFYFAIPAMMLFMIFGAVWWERLLGNAFTPRSIAAILVVLTVGLSALPFAAPILPINLMQAWANRIQNIEAGALVPEDAPLERFLPHFAEMHGWENLVELTASAFENLTPTETEDAVIVAAHYGQAGALNRLDIGGRLPEAHSGHMSYQVWGQYMNYRRGLFIGFDENNLRDMFGIVELRGSLDCKHCMQRENNLQIFYVDEPLLAPAAIRERIRRNYFF
jgi:hypothetical protein